MQMHITKLAFMCGNCGQFYLKRKELADHVKTLFPVTEKEKNTKTTKRNLLQDPNLLLV
jgi:hypothetical protein